MLCITYVYFIYNTYYVYFIYTMYYVYIVYKYILYM